jgi:hypothetical protein
MSGGKLIMRKRRPILTRQVGVRTASELGRKRRRLTRRNLSAEGVINRMREGARLYLHHDRSRGPVWRLSVIGLEVPDAIARLVIEHEGIVAAGDTLFPSATLSQTYKASEVRT